MNRFSSSTSDIGIGGERIVRGRSIFVEYRSRIVK